jgi:hypothetical protein
MGYELLLYNPSREPRGGYITIPWQPILEKTGYDPDALSLYQDSDTPLYYQVDQIDPKAPSRDTLSFFLSHSVAPGPENYSKPSGTIRIEGRPSESQKKRELPEQQPVLELSNNQLDVQFNLTPASENGEGCWYAGAARSIRPEKLRSYDHRLEYLDYYGAQFDPVHGHNPQKRCMQLDNIQLSHRDPKSGPYQQINLFNQPYRLVSQCKGPVRTCITIASKPFYYNYSPLFAADALPLKCELYRVLSLYEDRSYILEELFIDIKGHDKLDKKAIPKLYFVASYFTYMCMQDPSLSRFEQVPDWFSVSDFGSQLGYGFATDVHVETIMLPHPAFPHKNEDGNTFSFRLAPCEAAKCLHLFSRFRLSDLGPDQDKVTDLEQWSQYSRHYSPHWFESQIGYAWYEVIYKPLRTAAQGEDHVF